MTASLTRRAARRASNLLARLQGGPLGAATSAGGRLDSWAAGFDLLYGRAPTHEELRLLDLRQGANQEDGRRMLRRLLSAVDRDAAETSFVIRLTEAEVEWTCADGVHVALDRDDVAVSRHIAAGTYEPHLRALFERTLKPGMAVADVGANVGYYTAKAASLVGTSGTVTAFEPNSENARLLLLTIARNGLAQVSLKPFALGVEDGYVLFATALGTNGSQWPAGQEPLLAPSCMVVPVRRLDDMRLPGLDFMKIDVEGAESLVLNGASTTIERCRPVITTEFCPLMMGSIAKTSPRDFLLWFRRAGYEGALIERGSAEATESKILDVDAFVTDYGSDHRIEDLVFRPVV